MSKSTSKSNFSKANAKAHFSPYLRALPLPFSWCLELPFRTKVYLFNLFLSLTLCTQPTCSGTHNWTFFNPTVDDVEYCCGQKRSSSAFPRHPPRSLAAMSHGILFYFTPFLSNNSLITFYIAYINSSPSHLSTHKSSLSSFSLI